MKTLIDIRVLEDWANREFGSSLGQVLTDDGEHAFVRRIILEIGDPRLADLKARLERDHKKPAVLVNREYTNLELSDADLLQLIITAQFHQDACGEDFGTEYDDSGACSICGSGRVQSSPLRLDLSLAPSGVEIARTIALNEVIISQRFVDLMLRHRITGFHVREVEHTGNRKPNGHWYQLFVSGTAGQTVEPTHFGMNYFEDDIHGAYRCSTHLLSGLHKEKGTP